MPTARACMYCGRTTSTPDGVCRSCTVRSAPLRMRYHGVPCQLCRREKTWNDSAVCDSCETKENGKDAAYDHRSGAA